MAQVGESGAEKTNRGPIQAEPLWTVTESVPRQRWLPSQQSYETDPLYAITATKMTYTGATWSIMKTNAAPFFAPNLK